ncbi:hypothetical protein MHYP_G00017550 [Metynnis hypsauchen]
MGTRDELVLELKGWCQGESVDEAHAVLVLMQEDVTAAVIEETMQTVKSLGRVRVRGRTLSLRQNRFLVLCECKEAVKRDMVPFEVFPIDGGGPWSVVTVDEGPRASAQSQGPSQQAKDKPVDEQCTWFPEGDTAAKSTEAILRVVSEILDKSKSSSEHGSYRRLRTFSGLLPTPAGEEQFDHWFSQAWLMVEECDCSLKEKRRRLMESLRGPALEIVQAVRTGSLNVSPEACLEALEHAFGTAETGEELYFAFRLLQQQPTERLSDFLRRLEQSLNRVVQRGGLPSGCTDKVRLDQLLRGAIASDLMLINLRLRERKDKPPSFLQLLKEIRTEEEYEASRKKLHPVVQSAYVKQEVDEKQTEIQTLKSEMKELKSLVAAAVSKPIQDTLASTDQASHNAVSIECSSDSEITALKKQLKRLQQKFTKNVADPRAVVSSVKTSKLAASSSQRSLKVSEEHFCYRCGENGHFAGKCQNPENQAKVIKRLIQALKFSKTNKSSGDATASTMNCSVKNSTAHVPESVSIPDGLVGPPSLVPLKVNGQPCTALLDSGSQVTIIFEHWYQRYLSDILIQPVSGLSLWGLSESGVSYPYSGYVVVDLEYPAEVLGTVQTVTVLALICPSPRADDHTSVIVGTNASHVRRLVNQCKDNGVDVTQALGLRVRVSEGQPALKGVTVPVQEDNEAGRVRWMGPGPLTLPPHGDAPVVCKVELKKPVQQEILMMDSSPSVTLPADVFILPMVMPSGALDANSFKVLVRNESTREISIPVGTVIGSVFHIDSVSTIQSKETAPSNFDASQINFGDSPISEKWKNRLRQKLAQKSHVFSMNEWDVGLAKGVEHRIRLSDSRPFRQRSRRLAPADIEDVRRHLQELLQAGIIKDSRSPYASPIVVVRKKNGTVRMCIDYRLLNSRTVPDQYTTPCIEDALNALTGSQWFSVLDLRSGYYQIAMSEEDKEKTAFLCPLGFFQFERMPQGITGAPATFQRLMEKAVGDMNLLQVLVYLDDLIIFGKTLEEHEERLLKVLDRLGEVGLKLSVDKCQICLPRVKYLGHIVSADGVAPDPEKIEAVTTWPMPTNLKTLQSFLGFCGYYRRFIQNYSAIVRPLTELTKGLNAVGHRWLAALSTYEFDIQYRPGRHNIDADLLSRNTPDVDDDRWVTIPQSGVKTICRQVCVPEPVHSTPAYVAQLGASSHCVPDLYAYPMHMNLKSLELMSKQSLKKAQEGDEAIGPAIQAVQHGQWPDDASKNPELLRLKREIGKLSMKDGLLHRYTKKPSGEMVTKLKEDLKQAYRLASEAADKRHQRNKRLYDQRVTFQSLETGDRVLLRNLGLRGKHKLESKWSTEPYVVTGKLPNLPVFKIKREDGRPGTKTIHRDHLLPIGQLVRMPLTKQIEDPPARPRTRAVTQKKNQRDKSPETHELQEFSDSSSEVEYFVTHRAMPKHLARRVLNTARSVDIDDDPVPGNGHEPDHDADSEYDNDMRVEPVHGQDSDIEDDVLNSEPETEDERGKGCEREKTPENVRENGLESGEESVVEVQEERLNTRTEPRPKRTIKPTIKLTYDEPGRSSDKPLTIVHRGIVIKIGTP